MDNRDSRREQWSDLLGKIRDIKFAMLTTRNGENLLHSRPMATLQAEDEGALWFFTGRSTLKAREIAADPHVNLAYADGGHDTFVSVAGEARLVDDRAKAEELWNPLMKAWFPQGLDDPDLALMRVEVEEAEYWDTASKKMTPLLRFARALAGRGGRDETPGHGVLRPEDDGVEWDG
jgi:general stress protein 26